MSDLETTALRDLPESAYNFVCSSWVHSWRRRVGRNIDQDIYHRSFPKVANHIASHELVRVLHFPGNTDFYLGWIATSGPERLHYVYIRQNFRRQGNANTLIAAHTSKDATYSLQPVTEWQRLWLGRRMKHDPYQIAATLIGAHDEQATEDDDDPRPR
jgi:hypothetical protein|tara:strand:+ start:470 stop:943 length:474 start_codon:yes stop_codon:yes gene_type:complete